MIFVTDASDCATVTPQAVPESRAKPEVILECRVQAEALIQPTWRRFGEFRRVVGIRKQRLSGVTWGGEVRL